MSLQDYAHQEALTYGQNPELFKAVIKCESTWDPIARGDGGSSRGIAQISDIYHPEVSDAQADDPYYAITWMAQRWQKGYAKEWTCYRELI